MDRKTASAEDRRLVIQRELDAMKSQLERNRLGQFATPTELARDIMKASAPLLSASKKIIFLDPAFGTGAFYSALIHEFSDPRVESASAYEIDPHYGEPAKKLWESDRIKIEIADFTRAKPQKKFDFLVCNPPYVRHHHLTQSEKLRLQKKSSQISGIHLSGLSGLYCHFLILADAWMADGCVAAWLIPSEFMDVNYGQALKRYLLNDVSLLRIHRFDPAEAQFSDALVSSAIVWLKKSPPPKDHVVEFTFGGTACAPRMSRSIPAATLSDEKKWTRYPTAGARTAAAKITIGDLFDIKRGIATGDNQFFILGEDEISSRGLPKSLFKPILPSPRHIKEDEVMSRDDGSPDLEKRLFLLDTKLSEEMIREKHPTLFAYLEEAKSSGLHERYICSHRKPWYAQENRPAAPIVCTYLGRSDSKTGRPFRFILNHSRAVAANVYLVMYPKEFIAEALSKDKGLMRDIWRRLNSIPLENMLGEGRVYGGGLHKLEPKELANVDAGFVLDKIPHILDCRAAQLDFFDASKGSKASEQAGLTVLA
jgi:adenine-specific DNA-methyltransferase